MRMYVPLFALLGGLQIFSAFAETPQYRNKEDFDNSCRTYSSNYLRDDAFNDARSSFCTNAAKMFCADAGVCGNGGSTRRPLQVQLPATITPAAVSAEVQRLRGLCRNMGQKADQCCQGDSLNTTNCPVERSARVPGSNGSTSRPASNRQGGGTTPTVNEAFTQNRDMHDGASLNYASQGGACYGRVEVCTSQCAAAKAELERKVQGVACDGCMDAIGGLQTEIDQCESKRSQVTQSFQGVRDHTDASKSSEQGRKDTEAGKPGGGGDGDKTAGGPKENPKARNPLAGSGMNPMAMLGALSGIMNAMNQQGQPEAQPQQPMQTASIDQTDCSVNPYLAGCNSAAAQASDSWNKPKGDSFTPAGEESGNFNVGNLADGMNAASADTSGEPFRGQPASVAGVPNGGGGMPGGGGGGASASLGGGGGSGAAGAAAGKGKDIQITERGGGGGGGFQQMNAAMDMKTGGSGGYSYGGRDPASDYEGLDLSQFLPGGRQDPTRRLAGARMGGPSIEIQSKDVNIWNRISDRIRSRCNQGLLRDCVP